MCSWCYLELYPANITKSQQQNHIEQHAWKGASSISGVIPGEGYLCTGNRRCSSPVLALRLWLTSVTMLSARNDSRLHANQSLFSLHVLQVVLGVAHFCYNAVCQKRQPPVCKYDKSVSP